jgi:serine protease
VLDRERVAEGERLPVAAMLDTTRHRSVRRAALAAAVTCLGAAGVHASPARAAPWAAHKVIVGYRPRAGGPQPHATRAAPAPIRSRVIRLRHREGVPHALARLRRRPGVAFAQPDYVAHAAGSFYPDDHGRRGVRRGWEHQQWNLLPGTGVDAPQAWSNLLADGRAGGRGVKVAVLDTGVAYRHWQQFRRSPDFGNTRFVDPHDFVAHNDFPLDRNGHGTFVAGVLAESTNNRIGLTGLAYGASIMPVRVLDASGEGDESTIATGIRYAVAHGAAIINLSLEFPPSQVHTGRQIPEIVSAVSFARRHGVMVVGAAGNDETRTIAYPARVQGVVSVGATTSDGCLANYSNLGAGLSLVAPGGGTDAILPHDPACHPARSLPPIYQLTLTDPPHWSQFGYPNFYIGTSMSAPEVAATAALVIASRVLGPHPTPGQILARLEQTATPLPAGARQPNGTYGYGLLDAGAATDPLALPTRRHR